MLKVFFLKRLTTPGWARLLVMLVSLNLLLAACGEASQPATTNPAVPNVSNFYAAQSSSNASTGVTNQQGANQAGGTIRIYSSLPLTGSSKEQSVSLVNAMNMALDDVAGPDHTINGFKIDYVSLDDATPEKGQWDATQEAANATKAATDPDAMVYLGTFNSGAAQISIPILNQAGMAMISPANTATGLTKSLAGVTSAGEPNKYYLNNIRNYFRVVVRDDLQGPADVAYAADVLKAKSFFIIDDSQSYGKGLADSFQNEVKSRGLTLVGDRASITGTEDDYRDLARKVRAANPDLVFFGGIAQQQPGRLLADLRAGGVTAPFMGGDGLNDPAFIKEAAVTGEGAYTSISGVPTSQLPAAGKTFIANYQAKYGTPYNYTIYGYEVMAVALNAIKQAGTKDRAAILKAVAATSPQNYQSVLGSWTFDKNGDTTLTDFAIYQIQNGSFVYKQQTKPKASS